MRRYFVRVVRLHRVRLISASHCKACLGAIGKRMGWGGGLGPRPLHRSTQAFGAITIAQYAGCRRLQSSHSADGATLFPTGLVGLVHSLGLLQTLFDPGVASMQGLPPVAAHPAHTPVPTVEVLDVPATVPSLIRLGQRHHFINRRAPIRGLIQAPVNQTFQSVRLILRQIPPETALAHPQHLRRLGLRQPSCIPALIGFLEWPWP